jgi:DNA-directed RNA polymerase specialized sigma24 family protein
LEVAVPPNDTFAELLDRIANQDEAAVAEFVAQYEPELRVIARSWLRPSHDRLRAVVDSNDICQSVLAWFLLRGGVKQYDLGSPADLRRLLTVVARNRVNYYARRLRQLPTVGPVSDNLPGRTAPPQDEAVAQELAEMLETRLTTEEADLARRRMSGASWEEIATAVGGTSDARRMQLARAIRKLATLTPG